MAILENNQRADGSVVVPEALRPFVGRDVLEPVAKPKNAAKNSKNAAKSANAKKKG